MKFQLEELTEASLKEGEVDQLESDIKKFKTPKIKSRQTMHIKF